MTTLEELGGWSAVLGRLTARGDLRADEAAAALSDVLSGQASPVQIAAFAVALRTKGETVEELTGLVGAMLDAAERVVLPGGCDPVDTCGTGGNPSRQSAALNVSTTAAIVAAGAGVAVCKHGNRAASSTCGSADVLAELGVAIDLGPASVARCLAEAGIAFCLAPRFHPAMRHAGPVRRELGVPTVFNVLGPMSNPAGVRRQVLGVSDPALAERMAGVLAARGATRAMVVHGHDLIDELTTTTTTSVIELRDGELRRYVVAPAELGLRVADPGELRGGDAATNADIVRRALGGEPGAYRDVFLLNAAAAIVVGGGADDLAAGLVAAAQSIDSGAAAGALDRFVATSQALAAEEAREATT